MNEPDNAPNQRDRLCICLEAAVALERLQQCLEDGQQEVFHIGFVRHARRQKKHPAVKVRRAYDSLDRRNGCAINDV